MDDRSATELTMAEQSFTNSKAVSLLRSAAASLYSDRALEEWTRLSTAPGIDWSMLLGVAVEAGFGPIVRRAIEQAGTPNVPLELLEQLENLSYETITKNAAVMNGLEQIVHSMHQSGVTPIILKGAAFLYNLYPDVSLRPMIDIDLLVPFDLTERTRGILASEGYRPIQPQPFSDRSGWCWNEAIYVNDRIALPVIELHWHLLDNPYYARRITTERLYSRARSLALENLSALTLSPEDHILHLCSHSLHHHGGLMMRTGMDLGLLLARNGENLDWESLLDDMVRYDLILAVSSALLTAAERWYAAIPEPVLERLRQLRPSRREKWFVASQRSEFLKYLRTVLTLPGSRLKLRYLSGILFPTREFMAWRYHTPDDQPLSIAYLVRYAAGMKAFVKEISR